MIINKDIIPTDEIRIIEFHTANYDLTMTKKRIFDLFRKNNIKVVDSLADDSEYCKHGESMYLIQGTEINLVNLFWALDSDSFIIEHFLEDIREQNV